MGLRLFRFLSWSFFLSSPVILNATPVLRLVSSTVGPVAIATGSPGGTQIVEAFNVGDGALALSVTSSVPWIAASTANSRACAKTTQAATCVPIQLALNTQSLGAGVFTGIVRVSDPNAVDAPQTITVTVRVGGFDVYVAPGTSRDVSFATTAAISARTATQDGSGWLSVALDGTGSFRFAYPYRVRLTAGASQAPGNYRGSIVTSASSFTPDNVTIPITMRVATQPIAVPSPDYLNARLVEGAPAWTAQIDVNNAGTDSLSGITASATGGSWLAATSASNRISVTIDVGSLAPGRYSGSVAIGSNAANASVMVPVQLEVVPKGSPVIDYQGVQDNGTFIPGDTVAQGDIMVVKGEQLAHAPITFGSSAPLATEVDGASVFVNGQRAPMYYSTPGQLAFQMPTDAPLGTALVQVERDGQRSNTVSVAVASRAPRILLIRPGIPAVVNAADGSFAVAEGALPEYGPGTHPVKPGDILLIYAIGLGETSPAAGTGLASPSAEPLARLTAMPQAVFGFGISSVSATPSFAGLAPGYVGEYQVNVEIPENAPKGTVDLKLVFPDAVSNTVPIVIQ